MIKHGTPKKMITLEKNIYQRMFHSNHRYCTYIRAMSIITM